MLKESSDVSTDWYHSIEYAPGKYTQGKNFENIIGTRTLLSRIANLNGADCLDIGTVDTLIALLLERRGARFVMASDLVNLSQRVYWLFEQLNSNIEYLPNVPSMSYVDSICSWYNTRQLTGPDYFRNEAPSTPGFDLIVCSGFLYHVFSPVHALGQIRTLLRHNGLLVIETALVLEKASLMVSSFASDQYIYGRPGDTWFLSPSLLDHYLRFFKLKPIDTAYVQQGPGLVRAAVTCRAVDEWLCRGNEDLEGEYNNLEGRSLVDFKFPGAASTSLECLSETSQDSGINLYEALTNGTPEEYNADLIRLPIGAKV